MRQSRLPFASQADPRTGGFGRTRLHRGRADNRARRVELRCRTPKAGLLKPVRVRSRLAVNSAESAIASAVEGSGVICVYSYQVERELQQGSLALVLERFEPPPMPVHVIYAEARLAAAKTRAFVDLVVPKLKAELTRIGRRVAGATDATHPARLNRRRSPLDRVVHDARQRRTNTSPKRSAIASGIRYGSADRCTKIVLPVMRSI